MYKWALIIWALLFFPFINDVEAQNISNEGTDFWAVFPTHDPSRNGNNPPRLANIKIYVTSKNADTVRVRVSCGTYTEEKVIQPNVATAFDVPRSSAYIATEERNSSVSNRAIHVVSVDGHSKVAVYEHIYAGARSAASLILPTESLGQKYYSMNYTQDPGPGEVSQNFLVLVATEANTVIRLHKGTVVQQISLAQAGDVYEYFPDAKEDLTGTFVDIDPALPENCSKRFAAFSGSTSIGIGCTNSRDPLFQQLYPTISWGTKYAVIPFFERKYIVRVMAEKDGTNVSFNGQSVAVLGAGEYYTSTELVDPAFISADKKISVAQYSLTQNCSSASNVAKKGDPEMVMLNPIEFNIKSVTLFSSTLEAISERYINVCIKTTAAPSFKINGLAPANGTWTVIPSNPEYAYIQVRITATSSILTASDGFNAIAYGFGDVESYGYSAGTNLAANNYLLVKDKLTNNESANACLDQPSDFKISLPYKALKIVWKLDDEAAIENTPAPDSLITATGKVYTYLFPRNITFHDLTPHKMIVNAQMPNSENCLGGDIEYTFNFDVYPIPRGSFLVDQDVCADTDVQFTDASESNIPNKPVNKWLWDFGDGTTSTEQNPKHAFSTSGSKTVRLSAGLDDGCMSDPVAVTIAVRPKIIPKFNAVDTACVNEVINFTDQSSAEQNKPVTSWEWNFGDGSAVSTLKNPTHKYTAAGTYSVELIAKTIDSCTSLKFHKLIKINALPQTAFQLPVVCVSDDPAQFRNLTPGADLAGSGLHFVWNFGDTEVTNPLNNTSTQIHGTHQYTRAGTYRVILTAINASGCTLSDTLQLVVNSSEITPSFDVPEQDNLCSRNKIKVTDNSSITIGKIIKLKWFIDDVEYLTVDNPIAGTTYELAYPTFTDVLQKNVTIKLVAYSGLKCLEPLTKEVTIYASPIVHFAEMRPICLNAGTIRILQGTETVGVHGTFEYSGDGITPEGIFDPMAAGVGTHDITYTYTAHGCSDSKTMPITVTPLPEVVTDPDVYLLEGGEKQIAAYATGSNIRFKWTPAAGLDRDDVLNPKVKVDEDTNYLLTVTSDDGCSITKKITVHIKSIVVANAFSPNGDGINDTWGIKYIETYPNVTVDVFNRYGILVFSSRGYATQFDGNYQGNPLPVGTYYYMITPNNGRKKITGSLTLIR